MARAGILYSQVAKAASALAAAGANPTVDAVRAALGDTGSRSTLGPMLRQWRHEHQDQAAVVAAGLPADLFEAVQAVHQRIEGRAQARMDEARATYEYDREEMEKQLTSALAASKALQAERDGLASQLEAARKTLEHVQKEHHESETQVARLEAERDGQTQRLADRAAEVGLLAGQLTLAREQFEHYQMAAAEQREQDRRRYETRIGALEHEAERLRANLQEQHQTVAVLRSEKQGLELKVTEWGAASDKLEERLHDAIAEHAKERTEAGARQMAVDIALGKAENNILSQSRRIAELERENSLLRIQIETTVDKPVRSARKKR